MFKKVLSILLVITLFTGVCGCMRQNNKEINELDYKNEMLDYAQNKHSKYFEIVETIFTKKWFNTGMINNVLVVKDSEGITFNITASHANPYTFYDDYHEAVYADKISRDINTSELSNYADSKIYVMLHENYDFSTLDESDIKSITFIANVKEKPNDVILAELYQVYNQISQKRISNIFFIIGFTDNSPVFKKAVENYKVYGEAEWDDYSATVYAYINVFENGLSFEEFKSLLVEY